LLISFLNGVFVFKKKKKDFFEELFGYRLKNKTLYNQSLVHKSSNKLQHNERLEFLGDAVLSAIVSKTLYSSNPKEDEGTLSNKRSLIISRKNLNEIGKNILDDKLLIHNVKNITLNMYGNYLEAIIGALYLDGGIEKTENFIKKKIIDRTRLNNNIKVDFKSKLVSWSNIQNKNINFIVIESSGPDHKKKYNIGFLLNGELVENHWANSVKEGEQALAKKIYDEIDERNTFIRKDK